MNTKSVEDILATLKQAEEEYNLAVIEENYCNDKTQDILHQMELTELTYHQSAKLSRELTDIRRRRRVAKDKIELLAPLMDWIEKDRGAINAMKQTIGQMRKIDSKQANRLYYFRADNKGEIIR